VSALALDRISPTQRPPLSNGGTQRWTELLFVHWTYPIDVVRPLIPKEIELDPWDGRMYVGLVPFRMHAIRPWWLPRAMALDFLELNARTYVHYRGRPAVWFFSLEASSWLAVKAARTGWSLPYFHADMRVSREGEKVAYTSTRKDGTGAFDVRYEIGERLGPSMPGTLEHFLLERYLLLSTRRGVVLEGQVHHAPYPAHAARIERIDQQLTTAAGLPASEAPPAAVHFSPGVDVEVFGPWPVKT
jgi:uncharacterized protein YqjF (DUF2071 family)